MPNYTPRQLFKIAFLRKCAEAGLDVQGAVKVATALLKEDDQPKTAGALGDSVNKLTNLATVGYVAAPLAIGGLLGTAVGSAQNAADEDPEEIRTLEQIAAYKNLSNQMAIQRQLNLRKATARPPRSLLR